MRYFIAVVAAVCLVSPAASNIDSKQSAKRAAKVPRSKEDSDVTGRISEAPPPETKQSAKRAAEVPRKTEDSDVTDRNSEAPPPEIGKTTPLPFDIHSQQNTKRAAKATRKKQDRDPTEDNDAPHPERGKAPSLMKTSVVKAKAKKGSSDGSTEQNRREADNEESPKGSGVLSHAHPLVKPNAKKESTSVGEQKGSDAACASAESKSIGKEDPSGASSTLESREDNIQQASSSKATNRNSAKRQVVKAKSMTSSGMGSGDQSNASSHHEDTAVSSSAPAVSGDSGQKLSFVSGIDADHFESSIGSTDRIQDAPKSKGGERLSGTRSTVKVKPVKGGRKSSTPIGSEHEASGLSKEHRSENVVSLQSDIEMEITSQAIGNAAKVELSAGDVSLSIAPINRVTKLAASGSEVPPCAWTDDTSCPAFSVGDFIVGQIGIDVCPPGTTVVKTSLVCQGAAAAIGFPWNVEVFSEGAECYVCLGCAKPLGPETAIIRMNAAHGHLAKWICQAESAASLATAQASDANDTGKAVANTLSSVSTLGGTAKKVTKVPARVGISAQLTSSDGSVVEEVALEGCVQSDQIGCAATSVTSGASDLLQQRSNSVKDSTNRREASKAVKVTSSASKLADKSSEHERSPPSAVQAPVSIRAPLAQSSTLEIEKTSAAVAVKVPRNNKVPAKASPATKVPGGKVQSKRATKVPSAAATRTSAVVTKVPSSAPTKVGEIANAGKVIADSSLSPIGKQAPAERVLPFAGAALHASKLDAILDCASWHSCLDFRAFQKAAQYGLNNAILARRNVDADRGANQPPGMSDALNEALRAIGSFDDRRTEDAFKSAVASLNAFFDLASAWLAAVPAASIRFSGTYSSVKLPAAAKDSVDAGRILIKVRSGGSMPMLGFGTQCLANREVGRSVRWALKAGFRHVAVDSGGGADAAVGEELTRFGASAVGTGAKVFVTLRLSEGVWQARGGTVAELLAVQLKALQVPFVDLLVLPGPGPSRDAAAKAWREMEALHAGGRVKALGAANFSGVELEALMAGSRVLPDVVLAAHSVYNSGPGAWDEGGKDMVLSVARPKGAIVAVEGVLSGGADSTPPPLQDPHVQALARVYGTTAAQLLLRWEAQRGLAVLPCTKVRERIEQDVDIFSFEIGEFDMALLSHLAQLAETTPGKVHRPPWTADVFALTTTRAP